MLVVVSTSLLAILLTYLSAIPKYRKLKLFILAFLLVTFIACIQYNYGNDYSSYYYRFLEMSQNERVFELIRNGYYNEPGWALLNYIFPKPYGFFWIVAILNIIQNYIYYRFIRDNVDLPRRWISLSLYLLLTNFYVLNFSMKRQGFTIALCLAAGMYAGKKKWITAVIIVLIASTVHLSALVFLPFIFLCFLSFRKGHIYAVIFLVTSVVLFLFKNSTIKIFMLLLDNVSSFSSYLDYTNTIEGWGNTLGIGFLLNAVLYVVFFFFIIKRFDEFTFEQKLFMIYSCVAFLVIPFQITVSGIMGRIGTYFSVYQIAMVPIVYSKIKNILIRYMVAIIFIFMMFVGYYGFFFTSWSAISYSTFHTIFEVL
ncbi:MAG: EpsG family protein [Mobilitalea sp.]